MLQSKILTCRSDFYGFYGAFTVSVFYRMFWNRCKSTLVEINLRILRCLRCFYTPLYKKRQKNYQCTRTLARMRLKSHRKNRKNRKTHTSNPCKSTLVEFYGF